MKAFVAGATGQTGRRIVTELVKKEIPVRALVRDLESAKQVLPPTVELVVGDVMQPETLASGIGDSTVLLCATGAAPNFDFTGPYRVDYEGTKNLVQLARTEGIEQFVLVSSLCVSRFFHPLNLFWLVLFWKKQAEAYLQQSGLTYTIVRPGGLQNEDDARPLVMEEADTLFEGNIPRMKVAQVCVEALSIPAARNKIVEVVARSEATQQSFEQMFASVE
ncbi:MAG: NAD(P)H-binding protein [Microcoleaceae cyanobacterium]